MGGGEELASREVSSKAGARLLLLGTALEHPAPSQSNSLTSSVSVVYLVRN